MKQMILIAIFFAAIASGCSGRPEYTSSAQAAYGTFHDAGALTVKKSKKMKKKKVYASERQRPRPY